MKAGEGKVQEGQTYPLGVRLAAWLVAVLVRLIFRSCRVRIQDRSGLFCHPQPPPMIFAGWHNRLLFTTACFPWKFKGRTAALASLSRDGAYAAAFVENFGPTVVRGSTSRGGFRALLSLRRVLADNVSVCLTPDGPRGPRYAVQPGAVVLAEKSGCPVVPISLNAPKRWEMGGWDKAQIPRPFSTITLVVGAPLTVPANLSPEQRVQETERVRQALLAITDDTITSQPSDR